MTSTTKAVRFPNGGTYAYDPIWTRALNANECELLKGETAKTALEGYRRAELLKILKPGMTLTVVCTHRNSSGMSARFRVFAPILSDAGEPTIRELTRHIAEFVGFKANGSEIVMGGCGYSKSFQIVYSLGSMLWPNGTPEPHGTRNGEPDRAGGYALKAS